MNLNQLQRQIARRVWWSNVKHDVLGALILCAVFAVCLVVLYALGVPFN